jgi:hypothetical protein
VSTEQVQPNVAAGGTHTQSADEAAKKQAEIQTLLAKGYSQGEADYAAAIKLPK